MSEVRIGAVPLSQASSELAAKRGDGRDQRHLNRFVELPFLRQSHVPSNLAQPGLGTLAADYAEPELHNPQVLRAQNFSRLLMGIDEKLSTIANDDPVVKLTRLVLQQELNKHALLSEQTGALIER